MDHFTISGTMEYNNIVIYDSQHDAYYSVDLPHYRPQGSKFTRDLVYDKLVTSDFKLLFHSKFKAVDELTLRFAATNDVGKHNYCWVDCPRIFPHMHINLKDTSLTVEDYKRCIRSLQGFIVHTENKFMERMAEYDPSERNDYYGYNCQIVNGQIIDLTNTDK